ncbi:hypothetical protein [Cohnella fermenti]|uniref:hypothetical protein n=1 Tax=Cohnella fermenti TaxID=2565925 RepID=UPI001454CDDD|nr:hypothetical protein [Cohnella fermenti]
MIANWLLFLGEDMKSRQAAGGGTASLEGEKSPAVYYSQTFLTTGIYMVRRIFSFIVEF